MGELPEVAASRHLRVLKQNLEVRKGPHTGTMSSLTHRSHKGVFKRPTQAWAAGGPGPSYRHTSLLGDCLVLRLKPQILGRQGPKSSHCPPRDFRAGGREPAPFTAAPRRFSEARLLLSSSRRLCYS